MCGRDDYSDDDDEENSGEQAQVINVPTWAKSPALLKSLTQQRLVNPDVVFGDMESLRLEGLLLSLLYVIHMSQRFYYY